jgi:hypothetical protein
MADDFRYHIDHHGSLVRPAGLRAARAAGEPEPLAAAEEEAVIAALHVHRRLCTDFPADPAARCGHQAWPGAQPRRRGYLDRRPGDR